MKLTLRIWRQRDAKAAGAMEDFVVDDVNEHMSFLEMLDVLNEGLIGDGKDPVAFDHDCREGICGACSLYINGKPHGGFKNTTTCQVHMRHFNDGDVVTVEPWRARPFPVIKDLVVDRDAFDRIIQSGGFVSVRTGGTPDANAIPIAKPAADVAMDAAACIGCGACVAACKNASAMLFVSAKVGQFRHLPQGQVEQAARARKMVATMDAEAFGNCTNTYDCEAACPKGISVRFIAEMNRDFLKGQVSD
jgi:succinate dehydrogenase / fumarate reductase iron-sulfur subunit